MRRFSFPTVFTLVAVALVGCAGAAPMATLAPTNTAAPTRMPVDPTAVPTETPVLPTATAGQTEISTATPTQAAGPTATATEAAEATAAPTPEPPTATPVPEPTWKADGVIDEDEYAHQIVGADVTLYWTNDAEHLYGALSAPTQGWVAVGFDPQMRMQGANFVFAYIQGGQVFIQDMFGIRPQGSGAHPPDEQLGGQNGILEYGGREDAGRTTVEFKIPLNSGDEYDKPLLPGSRYTVILAHGLADDFETYHTDRGYGEIALD